MAATRHLLPPHRGNPRPPWLPREQPGSQGRRFEHHRAQLSAQFLYQAVHAPDPPLAASRPAPDHPAPTGDRRFSDLRPAPGLLVTIRRPPAAGPDATDECPET